MRILSRTLEKVLMSFVSICRCFYGNLKKNREVRGQIISDTQGGAGVVSKALRYTFFTLHFTVQSLRLKGEGSEKCQISDTYYLNGPLGLHHKTSFIFW
jgi:hypothetical protein